MKIGIALPHYDFSFWDGRPVDLDSTIEVARRAEDLGYDSAWVSDHVFLDLAKYGGPSRRYGALEPLTTLAAIAAETRTVRLGTMVLCEAFRAPPVLAKAAATLDVASGGRLDLGLGAGWYEPEYTAAGLPFGSPAERIARLTECAEIVGRMLADPPVTFQGRTYRVEEAPCDPRPVQRPRPPIWIGGKGGPGILRAVARAGDGWNTAWRWTPEGLGERVERLRIAYRDAGRDPGTARVSVGLPVLLGASGTEVEARWRDYQAWAPGGLLDGQHLADFATGTLTGTPDEVTGRIEAFRAVGVEEIIVNFAPLPFSVADPEAPERFAEAVIPKVRS